MRRAHALLAGVGIALASCATPGERPAQDRPGAIALSSLPGWAVEDHAAALAAYRRTCHVARSEPAAGACRVARSEAASDPAAVRAFLERRFVAVPVEGEGLLTAYFAPEYEAARIPDEIFSAPVRSPPPDLVRGAPYLERAEIERRPTEALAFMRPEDLFFMQIQGSGFLTFPDGSRARAAYAADNGRPFTGIARPMAERGLLERDRTSGEAIRGWLADNRGPAADEIMALNARYVFFRLEVDDGSDPVGAAAVPLPPRRAIAVDPSHHGYGTLFWISAETPALQSAVPVYRGLMTALDTGGAIRGPVRADLYMGRGEAAGLEAGRVKHPLKMWRIEPRP